MHNGPTGAAAQAGTARIAGSSVFGQVDAGGGALGGLDVHGDDQPVARAVGSLYQALFSGVLIQWLIDPSRAPSAADLATALQAIARQPA